MIDKLAAIEARLRAAARRHWSYRFEHAGDDAALWRMRIPARGRETARICLTAGTRGDALAGVEAALRLLEGGVVPPGVALDAFPVLNPDAVARGTREGGDGHDLGAAFHPGAGWPARARDFARAVEGARYALHVDLVEDPRLTGALALAPDGRGLGAAIAGTWSDQGLPLAAASQARRALTADGLAVAQARVGDGWADVPFAAMPRDGGQPAGYMRKRAAEQALALHAPGRADWELRVRTHLTGLQAALAALADPRFADLASSRRAIVPFRPGTHRAW